MARKPISPWFMYRRAEGSINDGDTPTELEFDFNIGQEQAIEITSSWMGVTETSYTPAPAAVQIANLSVSLHRRTGTLQDIGVAVDLDDTQSEVLQQAIFKFAAQNEAATRGGSAAAFVVEGAPFINWQDLLKEPLLVAANVTARFDPLGGVTGLVNWQGVYVALLYRYVKVTPADLVRAFIARQ